MTRPNRVRTAIQRMWPAAALGAALILSGCSVSADSNVQGAGGRATLTIKTHEYAFEVPSQVNAGYVDIILKNAGEAPHHAQLLQLNEGVTLEQFQTALQQSPDEALALVTLAGGPGPVDPGGSQTVTMELTPGQYVLIDLMAGADGVPNVAKGMLAPFAVVAGGNNRPQPRVDHEATLLDFSFTLPTEIEAGKQTWKIIDAGDEPHELNLMKLADGKSAQDVMEWLHSPSGPPPFASAGGLQGIDPGEAGYLRLDLTPGNYVAICHIPEPNSGQPHRDLGMIQTFAVD